MEVQKEAFSGLIEYYKLLPLETKRIEIIDELEQLISNFSNICTQFGVMPNMMLNKEMLNLNRKDILEGEFLDALFAYLNTLEDISAQFINKMSDVIETNSKDNLN